MAGFAVFLGLFAGGGFLLGLEFLDAAELVDKAHLAGEEGVALGADINSHAVFGGASYKSGTARTGDGDLMVGRVDT